MTETLLLGRRAVREVVRYPEATIPTLFIPLFFLVVNIGQVSKTFPSTTPFLPTNRLVAYGRGGSDRIELNYTLGNLKAAFYGEDGPDYIGECKTALTR